MAAMGGSWGGTEAELLGGLLVTLGLGEQRTENWARVGLAEPPKGLTVSSPLQAGANS